MSTHRLYHPEVTHYTKAGALDVKAGKVVCHNVGNLSSRRESLVLAAATCVDEMGGGELQLR